MPGHLPPIGDLVDAQSHSRKHVIDRQSAFTGNFRQRLSVGRVRPGFVRCDRSGSRIERNQRAGFGIDQCQPAGQRISRPREGIRASQVQNDHGRLQMQCGERPYVVGQSQGFDGYARIIRNARVDRNEIVLALQLHPISREIDVSDRIWT